MRYTMQKMIHGPSNVKFIKSSVFVDSLTMAFQCQHVGADTHHEFL